MVFIHETDWSSFATEKPVDRFLLDFQLAAMRGRIRFEAATQYLE